MTRPLYALCCFTLWGLTASRSVAVEPSAAEMATARRWIESKLGSRPGAELPFSFVLNGKPSAELLPAWKANFITRELDQKRTERTLTFTDLNTALTVRCVATVYRDFPAVEWVLHFENRGRADSPILSDVRALNADLDGPANDGEISLYHADGSHAIVTDFLPRRREIGRGESIVLSSFGGRSSDGALPFFNLATSVGGGLMIDVGWTGQWTASFARDKAGRVNLQAGMESLHAKLLPGEQIRTPSILLMFWGGSDQTRARNLHRRLLLSHYTPTAGGKPVDPPCAASPHAVVGFEKTNEANMLEQIGNIARRKIKVDIWWIDAGWYTCADNWARYVGNPQPDPQRFPHGLKPIAEAARDAGMRFLLWFEPERVMPGTAIYKEHPEWLLAPPPKMPTELMYQFNDGFHLFDLGNPQALAWVTKYLSAMIAGAGIDYYRNDFNMYPLFYWRKREAADRQGIREIRYITSLYTLFDTLRQRHPNLVIDTCASGGRRIDIEMLRRALVLTRSDYLWDPVGQQCHTFGLAQWIPITGIGAASLDAYSCRSGLGSHFTLAANYTSKDPAVWASIARVFGEYRSLKPFYTGDFYPLGSYSVARDQWMAWQFDRPDLGEGLVQAFRRQDCSDETATYRLAGLQRDATYEFTDLDKHKSQPMLGAESMERGLTIRLPGKPAAAILKYKKIGR
jgi:alpha-galactosidase